MVCSSRKSETLEEDARRNGPQTFWQRKWILKEREKPTRPAIVLAMLCLSALAFKACGECSETLRLQMRLDFAERQHLLDRREARPEMPTLRSPPPQLRDEFLKL